MQPADAARSRGSGWRALLELGFERRGDQSVLVRRRHQGPLLVQRTFRPEAGA